MYIDLAYALDKSLGKQTTKNLMYKRKSYSQNAPLLIAFAYSSALKTD